MQKSRKLGKTTDFFKNFRKMIEYSKKFKENDKQEFTVNPKGFLISNKTLKKTIEIITPSKKSHKLSKANKVKYKLNER